MWDKSSLYFNPRQTVELTRTLLSYSVEFHNKNYQNFFFYFICLERSVWRRNIRLKVPLRPLTWKTPYQKKWTIFRPNPSNEPLGILSPLWEIVRSFPIKLSRISIEDTISGSISFFRASITCPTSFTWSQTGIVVTILIGKISYRDETFKDLDLLFYIYKV